MSSTGFVLDQDHKIMFFHFLTQRGAIRLEGKGLRHSSGRSVLAHVKRTYGLKGNRDKVLTWMDRVVEEVNRELRRGSEATSGVS